MSKNVLLFLWTELIKEKKLLFFSTLLALVIALTETRLMSIIPRFVDDALLPRNMNLVIWVSGGLVLLMMVDGMARFSHRYLLRLATERTIRRFRLRVFERFLLFSKEKLSKFHSGQAAHHLSSDIQVLTNANHVISDLIREPLIFVALTSYLFYLHWQLTLICIISIPIIALVARKLGQSARRNQSRLQSSLQDISEHVIESMQGLETAQSLNQTPALYKEFEESTNQTYNYLIRLAKVDELVGPLTKVVTSMVGAVLVLVGGYFVVHGTLSTGELFGFITTSAMLQHPLRQLNSCNIRLQQVLAAGERLFKICDEPLDSVSLAQQQTLQGKHTLQKTEQTQPMLIECKDLSYLYPTSDSTSDSISGSTDGPTEVTHQDQWALHHFNYTFEPEKTYALVGKSGAGKSTLSFLLMRFLEPSLGSVRIGNKIQSDWDLNQYRNLFCYVSQSPYLFSRSVRENLLLANPNASEQQLWKALDQASLKDFVEHLPNGLDTEVAENARRFSGGERQRLAIARAFLRDSPFVIFDEATANLDSENENLVHQSLSRLKKGRSTILIAHRFSSLKEADQILTLSQGRLVEHGIQSELIQKKGHFFDLWKHQTLNT